MFVHFDWIVVCARGELVDSDTISKRQSSEKIKNQHECDLLRWAAMQIKQETMNADGALIFIQPFSLSNDRVFRFNSRELDPSLFPPHKRDLNHHQELLAVAAHTSSAPIHRDAGVN